MFKNFDTLVDNFFDSFPKSKTEYELKYNWGGWVTMDRFYAKSDNDAINHADIKINPNDNPIKYALFKGKRIIKNY